MGDPPNALLWVRAAVDSAESTNSSDRSAVAFVLDNAPELVGLQHDDEFVAARTLLN
jgi:hypothetical protein